ncbi:maleylpyruvate isomerase N-terminal domain-containing protein [Kocuria sp. NPDC057446]|uniref:maleylpyruvate isomerase N-terminal domain-containing protein n=1 Tax=Kocuria sp. NPDC057446 TaxID=3346137 RepID=UPI0036B73D0C
MNRVVDDSADGRRSDDDVWAVIDLQRRGTADLLAGISGERWDEPSLCEGWTVRDVAAHLTLQQLGLGAALLLLLTGGGAEVLRHRLTPA